MAHFHVTSHKRPQPQPHHTSPHILTSTFRSLDIRSLADNMLQYYGDAMHPVALVILLMIYSSDALSIHQQHRRSQDMSSNAASGPIKPSDQLNNQATLVKKEGFDRTAAQQIVTNILCPPNEERSRNIAGMEVFGGDINSRVITREDPRSEYTYDEFPFDSFDLLVDRALEYLNETTQNRKKMVDVGSGCGRLVLYAGLTRSDLDVAGIEIGHQLHSLAVNSLQRGINEYLLKPCIIDDNSSANSQTISLYNGNALIGRKDPYFHKTQSDKNTIQSILSQANLLFAYSTVFETDSAQSFNPELQAMVLSSKWSKSLALTCQNGVVAITTDRILNPDDGWKLLDRIEVDNPSVWGSIGFISQLDLTRK